MFCDKCGAQIPDGIRFCGQCGNVINQQPAPQPAPQPVYQPPVQPAYQQPVYQQQAYQQPMTRDQFIGSNGAQNGLIVRIALAVCALILVIGLCTTLWGSILNNPTLQTVATLADADVSELEDELDNMKDELKEYEDYYDLSNEEEEIMEAVEKLCDQPSLMNVRKIAKMAADREYSDAFGGLDSADREEAEMLLAVMNGAIIGLVISFLIGLVLTGLACWKRNTVLIVFGMLFSVGNCFSASGTLLGILVLALYIVAIVINVKLSNQYKAYKRSLGIYA